MTLMLAPPGVVVSAQFKSPLTGSTYTVDSAGIVSVTSQTDVVSLQALGFQQLWGGRNNLGASTDPIVGSDNTADYQPGSIWINSTASPPRAWICVTAATGAAVWVQIGIGALIGSANDLNVGSATLAGLIQYYANAAVTPFSGGGQSSATSLTATISNVTSSVASSSPYDSVKFSMSAVGTTQVVFNTSANPIQVFGTGSATINGFTNTVGITLPAGSFFEGTLVATNTIVGRIYGMGLTTNVVYTTNTATSGTTLAGANVSGGINEVTLAMTGTMSGDSNAQLPLVSSLVAAIPNPVGGYSYKLRIVNESSANHTWTITTNTGWTLNGTMTIAQNTWRDFYLTLNSLTTATLQNVGTGTFS